ncbi:MAG TPA: hypothetical protein VK638_50360 [Edaphobacter sp.]|nr:hypothetical protein [Edaphobacter sp.]
MANNTVALYFGDSLGYSEPKDYDQVRMWMQEGSVIEVKMLTPTRRNPEKYRTVYKWIGEKTQELRDLSAEMPPAVTEMAATGNRMHKAFAFSYRGIMMGNASRPIMVPA